jgi:hypothetical protein
MIYPTDGSQDAQFASDPSSMPADAPETTLPEPSPNQPSAPANENFVTQQTPAAHAFEQGAEDSFRIASATKLDLDEFYSAGSEVYENLFHALRTSFEELATGISQLNWKLMEFGRVNAESNLAFVQNAAGIRNVREAVDVQTAHLREQYEAGVAQMRELQALTAEIAEKTAAPFKQQFERAGQMFRSC